ncbi:MAG TPA: choice-of-anchor D domain-containing protein [Streptosporangiaceae bacterium]|nr:choice-of-anchor D domain-containing protein [Streptosporangiaceae bacterium]
MRRAHRVPVRRFAGQASQAPSLRGLAARLSAALVLAAAGVAAGVLPYPSVPSSRADELTMSGGNLRNGWDPGETTGSLSPTALLSGSFGQLFSTTVNGQVYAQPVVVGNTVIVATENDMVYGLDAASGAIKWSTSLGTPWPAAAENCTDLAPNVGVTGTPVYDPASNAVYMVSQVVPPGHTDEQPVFHMDALNPQTGAELPGWPVTIGGAPVNDPTAPFNSFTELQRPGLLLLGGSVYAGFGSHCDFTPYDGYVVGVNTTTQATTMWTDEAGLTSTQAGIWQSGGGLLSDGSGRIFFASGNGVSPAPGPGTSPPAQLAEAVVRLGVQGDGSLAAQDFFSPSNAPHLDAIDGDFGSGGPIGLPFNTAALPDLLLQAGKVDGLYVLNANNLGGRSQGPGGTDAVVSEAGKGLPGQWGHPSAFADTPTLTTADVAASNDYVYYVGKNDVLRYYKAGLGGTSGLTPVLTDVAQSSDTFGYTSGSPVVTSNGTDPASGVVWVVKSSDDSGTTGTLEAFPVVPPGTCTGTSPCTVSPTWTSAPFTRAGKFTTPATDSGRIYIATRGVISNGTNCPTVPSGSYCGQVLAFGSPSSAPLGGASPVNFGSVPVGSMSTATEVTVTDTSSGPVNVSQPATSGTGFAVAGPFQYLPSGSSTPTTITSWPQLLNAGDSLIANGVTVTPAGPGGVSGSLQFGTDSANFPVVGVSLSGIGTQNGFYASSSSVNFGASVPVGTTTQVQVTVTNGEPVPETLIEANPKLGAPFSVSGLPSSSTEIQPGASVPLTLKYSPTAINASDAGSLTLTGNDGTVQTQTVISLAGNGAADVVPTMMATPTSLSFGSVSLGQHAQLAISVANSGNLPATITVTAPPSIPFGAPDPIATGLPVNPGSAVSIPVTFTPTSIGPVAASYNLTWTDVAGTHQLSVPITGTGAAPSAGIAVPPPGGGWFFNGSAVMTGTSLSLTPLQASKAGSSVYSAAVPSNGLKATFTAQIGGGSGADGMTLSLLDSSKANPRSLGGTGAQLGFGGLPGVAVTLDTSKDGTGYPAANFVGIATGVKNGLLIFAATSTKVPNLRSGSHTVGVSVSGSTITVTVDGKQYLSKSVTLPPMVRLAFTAATGSRTDHHIVTAAHITAAGHAIPAPGGGWSYNGKSAMSGPDTSLTPVLANQAGAVVYPTPVTGNGLSVTFDLQMNGGSGGDGMAFALLDPSKSSPSSVGGNGSLIGLGGMPGVAVILGTEPAATGWPKGQFIALTTGETGGVLVPQVASQGIGPLRSGTHIVTVTVTNGGTLGEVMTVWLDGVKVLQSAEPTLTSTVRLAFTAGTGTLTDLHIVRGVSIAASG